MMEKTRTFHSKKRNKVIEGMRTIYIGRDRTQFSYDYRIRLWIKKNGLNDINSNKTFINIEAFVLAWMDGFDIGGNLANSVAEIFKNELAAVEMVDYQGFGVVIYPDWN